MSSRDKLITAGLELFHRYGIHPVGLDRILHKAGVTKTTFYKYFESKEDFTCAVIDRFGEEVLTSINRRINIPADGDAKQKLMQIFDAWDKLFEITSFQGCMLVGAGVSTADKNDPIRKAAIKNKRRLLLIYEQLANEVGIRDPQKFAIRFGVLVDGALVTKHLYGNNGEASEVLHMAERLIEESIKDYS